MHPNVGITAAVRLALGDFIFVVGEFEIVATAMDIKMAA